MTMEFASAFMLACEKLLGFHGDHRPMFAAFAEDRNPIIAVAEHATTCFILISRLQSRISGHDAFSLTFLMGLLREVN